MRKDRIALLIIILLSGLVAGQIAHSIWVHRDYPFDADEANHANGGLAIALDLKAGDLGAAIDTFYRQGFYPPAFSIPKALAFLIFGPTPLVARMLSLACLLAAMPLIYQTARQMDADWGWMIGLIAVSLTLTSHPLLIQAGLVMMETPGLLASFGMLCLYMTTMQHPQPWRLAGTSLMLLVTFLTKYTYGLPAIATILIIEASLLLEKKESPIHTKRWLWLLGPFVLAMIYWFAKPYKIAAFWDYATAQPANWQWNLESVIFYPRSIAIHHTPSPPFALLTLLSIGWAFVHWRDRRVRVLLIYFCVGMGEMFINFPKNPRFITTFVPAAHILTGDMCAWFIERWRQKPHAGRNIASDSVKTPCRFSLSPKRETPLSKRANALLNVTFIVLLAASLIAAVPVLFHRFSTYPSVMEVAYETNPKLNDLASWIQARTPPGARFYLINFWDQFSPQMLAWHLGTYNPPPGTRLDDILMPSILLQESSAENIAALQKEILASDVQYVVSFEGTPWGAPVWWKYADAMEDTLPIVDREVIYVDLYDTRGWLKHSLLTQEAWKQVKKDSQYTLQVQTTIYAVQNP